MAGRLDGQVAVVTGSSRGIGRACALELAREGASVVVNYNGSEESAASCKDEIEALGEKALVVQADVSNAEDAARLIAAAEEEFGKVDILVNNAGINRDRTVARMSAEEWDNVISTDLSSMFYCTNAVVGGMRERNFGRIINMASNHRSDGQPRTVELRGSQGRHDRLHEGGREGARPQPDHR